MVFPLSQSLSANWCLLHFHWLSIKWAQPPYSVFAPFGAELGVWRKFCIVGIHFNTSKVNSSICVLMYFMKELLAHCLIIIIAKIGTPPRYVAFADSDLIECVPTSWASMHSAASPYAFTPSRRAFSTILLVTCSILPLFQMADTGIALEAPLYAEMRVTSAVHCMTGQRMGSFVFHCVMVFNFLPFFCILKVMASLFAELRFGEELGILLLSL